MYGFPATSADKKNGAVKLPSFGLHAVDWGQDVFGKGKYPGQWSLSTKGSDNNEYGWREWAHLQVSNPIQTQLWGAYTQDLWNTGKWKPQDMIGGDSRGTFYQRKYGSG